MALKLKSKISPVFLPLAILALSLSGCNPNVELVPTSTTSLTTPDPTPTSPPTSTTSPPSVVFVPPDDDFLSLADPISSTLEQLAAQSGWTFVLANPLSPEIINREIGVLVFIEPTDEILELIETRSDTQFIAIGVEGLAPQANLSLIGPDGFRLDQQAFLAGYIAALMTQDWRVGEIIGVSEQDLSTIELGFRNGMKFFCGLCLLSYPPFHNYPVYSTLDSDWKMSIDILQSYAVKTIFLFVQEYDLDAMDSLFESDIFLLGITSPPKDIRSLWLATIRHKPEDILIEKWGDITSGIGGWIEHIPLVLEDVDSSIFSEGRQRFIDQVLFDIQAGFIDPAVTPPAPIGN